jgi:alpha-glucosidase
MTNPVKGLWNSIQGMVRLTRDMGPQIATDALRYRLRKSIFDIRHPAHKANGSFKTLGAVRAIERHERGLMLTCERGTLRLTVLAPDLIQVRMQPDGRFQVPFSYAVAKVTWPEIDFKFSEGDADITLSTAELTCTIHRSDSRLTLTNKGGHWLGGDGAGIAWRGSEVQLSRMLTPDELCLGLAEQPVGLDVRGQRYIVWNTSPTRYERNTIPIYFTIPFYLSVFSDRVGGFFWDNPARGWVDAGAHDKGQITFNSETGELRCYLFGGPDVLTVLNRYTELTGRMPLPPRWALGYHQSRWSYETAERVREIAAGFRKRHIPCDVIHLDIDYMDGYRCFTWDRDRFPAPAVLVSDLAADGFKTVAILDPGLKADADYKVDQSGLREGMFVKYPDGQPFVGPVWAGSSHFPDFTHPGTRRWWAAQFESFAKIGIAGIWNDMNEPVLFNLGADRQMPDAVRHDFEGAGASHVEAHNVYGALMGRASREGLERWQPGKRPFNITRAAYAGSQRYASSWTGDNLSTWDHLRLSITMTLNSGLSGIAFTGPDTGGFGGNPEPELFVRWLQLSSLLPFFRVHSSKKTRDQEPWSFGQPYEDLARTAIERRYQLLPYLYSLFAQCSQNGWPIVRPVFMADPSDARLRSVEDAYMLGDWLYVAPVLDKGATARDVVLPRGGWYDFNTGRFIEGGGTIHVEAPLDTLPIFARAGAIIPLWPSMQYVGGAPIEELR